MKAEEETKIIDKTITEIINVEDSNTLTLKREDGLPMEFTFTDDTTFSGILNADKTAITNKGTLSLSAEQILFRDSNITNDCVNNIYLVDTNIGSTTTVGN